MPGERVRRRRLPVALEPDGARAHDAAHLADPRGEQRAVRQGADAHRDVEVLVDEVQHAVGLHQTHVDVRMGGEEVRDERQHVTASEHDRGGHDQLAADPRVLAGRRALGLAHVVEDAPRRGDVIRADPGQLQASPRAHEQPHAEVRLELGDVSAHRAQRPVQASGRPREAAGLDRREQQRHRLQPIHSSLPDSGNPLPVTADCSISGKAIG